MAGSPAQIVQGPFFIGLIINILLHGVLTTQVYLYFTTHNNDRLWLKMLIILLYIADTFNCMISIYYIYDVLVTHFGDEANLSIANWAFATDAVLTGAIGGAVQHFFAWRVYVMTEKAFVVLAIVLCSLVNLAGSLGATVGVALNPNLLLLPRLTVEVTMWLVGAVLADTIIAVSLVWHLRRYRHLYPALTSTINRILRTTVQTGVLTTIVAIVDLTCYLTISSGIHLIFNIPLSKLYTNCMLSSLNARKEWKYDGSAEEPSLGGISSRFSAFQIQHTQPEVSVCVEPYWMAVTDDKPHDSLSHHCGTSKHVWSRKEDGSSIGDVCKDVPIVP